MSRVPEFLWNRATRSAEVDLTSESQLSLSVTKVCRVTCFRGLVRYSVVLATQEGLVNRINFANI